ncbi:MAG TPA: hypothetical protein V6C76_10640 [Drouetiella sp.]
MNIKALTLSIISVATAVAASQPANAQDRPSARWDFAPNVWKKESIAMPRGYNAPTPAAVRAGSMPTKNSLLGDPGFLAKAPTAPLIHVNQQVAAVPLPKPAPNPFEAFKNAFGKPISSTPMIAQSLPPMSVPAVSANKGVHAVLAHKPVSVGTGVHGVLHSHRPVGATAKPAALPPVANYGNTGYRPGAFTPTAGSGSNMSTSANVSGVLLPRK